MELADSAKVLVNSVFDCFLPELHEEVVKGARNRAAKLAESKKASGRPETVESKYVEMEPIKPIAELTVNEGEASALSLGGR